MKEYHLSIGQWLVSDLGSFANFCFPGNADFFFVAEASPTSPKNVRHDAIVAKPQQSNTKTIVQSVRKQFCRFDSSQAQGDEDESVDGTTDNNSGEEIEASPLSLLYRRSKRRKIVETTSSSTNAAAHRLPNIVGPPLPLPREAAAASEGRNETSKKVPNPTSFLRAVPEKDDDEEDAYSRSETDIPGTSMNDDSPLGRGADGIITNAKYLSRQGTARGDGIAVTVMPPPRTSRNLTPVPPKSIYVRATDFHFLS
jgi:hypothetical protein